MRRTAPSFPLSLSLLLPPAVRSDYNRPSFRGPTADGHSAAKNLPVTWSEKDNVRWKTPIHDKGWSSRVAWANRSGSPTATEEGTKLFAVCVDPDSGKTICTT